MEKTELVIIRHGETEWNTQHRMQGHSNSNLTKLGNLQIKALGDWMKKTTFSHVYSSDSPRARETAEAITVHSGHFLNIDKRLRERNLGIFEGLTSEEAMQKHPEIYRLFKTAGAEYVIENGESIHQLLERAFQFIEEIRINHPFQRVLLITHAGVVRVLIKNILGISLESSTLFKIKNTGLFRLVWEDKWVVSQLGEVSHLENLNGIF